MKRGKSVDVHRGVEAIMVLVFFSALMGCSLLKPSTKETSELPASSEVEQAGDLVLPSSAVRHASVCHNEKRADKERGLACAQLAEQHKRLSKRLFAAKRSGWKGAYSHAYEHYRRACDLLDDCDGHCETAHGFSGEQRCEDVVWTDAEKRGEIETRRCLENRAGSNRRLSCHDEGHPLFGGKADCNRYDFHPCESRNSLGDAEMACEQNGDCQGGD